jgi:hypothetical protein
MAKTQLLKITKIMLLRLIKKAEANTEPNTILE